MKTREPKPTDSDNIGKAYRILTETVLLHLQEIEPALFIAAMFHTIAVCYKKSEVPKDLWEQEMKKMIAEHLVNWEKL